MQKDKKRFFSQRELEKHINARLMRERKKYDGLEALRAMLEELMDSGKIDADSCAGAAEQLTALLAGNRRSEKPQNPAMKKGTMPEKPDFDDAKTTEAPTGELASSVEKAETKPYEQRTDFEDGVGTGTFEDGLGEENKHKEGRSGNENLSARLALICSEMSELLKGGAPMGELASSVEKAETKPYEQRADFENGVGTGTFEDSLGKENKHKEGKSENGNLSARLAFVCSELSELLKGATLTGSAAEENIDDAAEFADRRAACSTGFSSRSASDSFSAGFELTPMQREIARRAGISYREYADMLREIPQNTKRARPYR